MKKFVNYGLSLMLIASPFLITSCGEDGETPEPDAPAAPTVSIADAEDEDETTIEIGQEVAFTVNATAPGIFNAFIVNKTVDGGSTEEVERIPRDAGTSPTTYDYDFTFTADEEDAGKEIIFDFIAVDDNDNEGQATYTISVSEQKVNAFPAKLLYAPAGDGTTKTFFSANTGESYSSNDVTGTTEQVSILLDFGYFYGNDMGATLASPGNFPFEVGQEDWTERNNTLLKKTELSVSAFNESNATVIESAFDDANFGTHEQEGQARNLEVDDVIAFETDNDKEGGSRRGLIRVIEIQPGTKNVDYIEIEVRIID